MQNKMLRSIKIKSLSVAVSTLILSTNLSAAIIDQGSSTLDTDTGLVWLDVTETLGMSYNHVINELGEGGQFYGYRYATGDELQVLLTNIGFSGVNSSSALVFPGESTLLEQTIQLLGDTRINSDPDLVSGGTWGLVEWCCNSITGDVFPNTANLQDLDYLNGDGTIDYTYDYIQIYNGAISQDYFNQKLGSFLVEGTYEPMSAVPIPAGVWLFGSGLLGLIGVARRKKS